MQKPSTHSASQTVILAGDTRPSEGLLASLFVQAFSSLAPTRAKRERKLWGHSIARNALRKEIRQHNAKVEATRNTQLRQRVANQESRLILCRNDPQNDDSFLNKSARRRTEG